MKDGKKHFLCDVNGFIYAFYAIAFFVFSWNLEVGSAQQSLLKPCANRGFGDEE